MSLSRYIQSPELLRNISGSNPEELKREVLDRGKRWYSENPGEVELITENLRKLEIPFTAELVEKIKINVILHYYEKLLPLCGGAEFYHSFLKKHVDCTDAAEFLRQSIEWKRNSSDSCAFRSSRISGSIPFDFQDSDQYRVTLYNGAVFQDGSTAIKDHGGKRAVRADKVHRDR